MVQKNFSISKFNNSSSYAGEKTMRQSVPVFINSFNQPTYLDELVRQLLSHGFEKITVCDNNSRSPEILRLLEEWDADRKVRVFRLGENLGPHETFRRILSTQSSPFVFSDPDVQFSGSIAEDFLSRLHDVSRRYQCQKVGAALEIPADDEIKDITMRHLSLGEYDIACWENQFWLNELEKDVYRANVDTTLFYWNNSIKIDFRRSYNYYRSRFRPRRFIKHIPKIYFTDIRVAGEGFTLRHLPWYLEDKMSDSERDFYRKEAAKWSTWVR